MQANFDAVLVAVVDFIVFDEEWFELVIEIDGVVLSFKIKVVAVYASTVVFVVNKIAGAVEEVIFDYKFGVGSNSVATTSDNKASDAGHGRNVKGYGDGSFVFVSVDDGCVVFGVFGVIGLGYKADGFVNSDASDVGPGFDDDDISGASGVDSSLDCGVVVRNSD